MSAPPPPPPLDSGNLIHSRAIVFSAFSLLIALLICPPLTWHFKNRNIGATVLVACALYANLQSFVNAIIWSHDDVSSWYTGEGLCDVEVKLQVVLQNALPAAISCILRALAKVMDTERSSWGITRAQRRRGYAIDLLCCVGIPLLQMPFHWIVQPFRYYVFGITGCYASLSISWPMVVLILMPPLLWTLLDVYYSVLILYRLMKYRLQFRSILANNQTTRSRFLRLYALCALCTLAYFPLHVYTFYATIGNDGLGPFSWNDVHHPTAYSWDAVVMVPSDGNILWDRYIWLAGGIVIFMIFGFGKDAVRMYRDVLLACGFGKIWPSLKEGSPRASPATTMSSVGSKARMFFSKNRKDSMSTSPTTLGSFDSASKSVTDSEPSPKKMSFLETINEGRGSNQQNQYTATTSPPTKEKPWNRLTAHFKKDRSPAMRSNSNDHFVLSQISTPQNVQSNVVAEPVSPTMASHIRSQSRGDGDVLIRKEIRQNSETAGSVGVKDFGGV
ncbi:hypothetical protein CKM354_001123200 [Cercospora kikuchii]|uniref:Pheromone a factor receptor n=1 Tax=Cercospora kikuchii TaxID=84275 RepID=A0A9P3CP65_9PEZI|nr:uncharacterized protein CKM354_001123200 [Cercospora kikuchii]GIZ48159.1 hypothetical protein CKM354_001123200 [Cercospora kikuchii]